MFQLHAMSVNGEVAGCHGFEEVFFFPCDYDCTLYIYLLLVQLIASTAAATVAATRRCWCRCRL